MRMRHRAAVGAGAGPFDFAGGVGFLLPDGHTGFDGVDEKAVGLKSSFAMGGTGEGNDGALTNREGADTVNGDGFCNGEFFHRFSEDAFAFLLREDGMVGVVELGDVATFVMIADEAFEDDEGTAGRIVHPGAEGGEIEGSFLNGEHDQLTSRKRRHEGDCLAGSEEIGPVGELVIKGGFDVREIESELML